MAQYSIAQLMTCVIARDLADDDRVAFGLRAYIGLGAALLAQKLYAPKLQIRHGLYATDHPPLAAAAWSPDDQTSGYISYFETHDEMLLWANPESSQSFSNVFFIGGLQIDQYGATNLIGIKRSQTTSPGMRKATSRTTRSFSEFLVRGPGSIGTPSAALYCSKYYIFMPKHTRTVFVPQVDYVSVPGTDRLRVLGYTGKKPRLCITPLGVFDWDTEGGTMQLRSLHPGVSLDQVQRSTGFPVALPSSIEETPRLTNAEADALAEIDPTGIITALDAELATT
jgi:glutaconate CoA-transferase subunit B